MKTPSIFLATLLCSFPVTNHAATIAAFDIIDNLFNTTSAGYTGPGQYDIFNATTGLTFGNVGFTPDGQNDIEVKITPFGTGLLNGVTYNASVGISGTVGLISTLSTSGSSPTSNNNGHRWGNTIDILFLAGTTVTAGQISDYSFSSGNSGSIFWEVSQIQYLTPAAVVIGTAATIAPNLSHTAINGISNNTFVADSTNSVTGVGTASTAAGSNGPNDNMGVAFDTPVELGIGSAISIGGVRFIHFLEDVRGTSNANSTITNTINDLDLSNFTVTAIPEPSRLTLLLGALIPLFLRRFRR